MCCLTAGPEPSVTAHTPSPAAASSSAAPAPSESGNWPGPDESQPATSIQLRLHDGSRLVARFNLRQAPAPRRLDMAGRQKVRRHVEPSVLRVCNSSGFEV